MLKKFQIGCTVLSIEWGVGPGMAGWSVASLPVTMCEGHGRGRDQQHWVSPHHPQSWQEQGELCPLLSSARSYSLPTATFGFLLWPLTRAGYCTTYPAVLGVPESHVQAHSSSPTFSQHSWGAGKRALQTHPSTVGRAKTVPGYCTESGLSFNYLLSVH